MNLFLCYGCALGLIASVFGSTPTTKYNYVGCYEDRDDIRMFAKKIEGDEALLSFLNPNPCTDKCAESGFPYAGVSGQECYCSHDYASQIAKTSDLECDSLWLQKFPKAYSPRIAVYETGVAVAAVNPARIYLGCYRDDNAEFRLLKSTNHPFPKDNSPATCHNYCTKAGHRYFGLTNKEECWCGDTKPSSNVLVEESECSAPCTGSAYLKCGGGWRLSVYATGITDFPSDGRYIGCYKHSEEEDSVFISEYTVVLKTSNSPRRCLNICNQFGYKYSAVQNRDGCYCGNSLPPSSSREADKSCNAIKCVGEPTETCGSKYHIKIFRTLKEEKIPTSTIAEYLGCYKDQEENPVLEESSLLLRQSLTPDLCISICQQRGYPYAGLKFGKYCQCDYYYPSSLVLAPEKDCLTPCPGNPSAYCGGPSRLSTYYTGLPRFGIMPASIYQGCFRDDDKNNRMLKGTWQELDNDSPKVCQRLCYKTGFRYFGLTWIRECFCGDEDPSAELLIDEVECNKPCGGDSNKICGGGWRTSIYATGLTDIQIGNRYVGCYTNPSSMTVLNEYVVTLSRSNSPQRCLNVCDQLDYRYAGVERGIDCRCGNKLPDESLKDSGTNACDIKCPGDESDTCGKTNKVRIFSTTKADVPEQPSEDIDVRVDEMATKKCGDTYTTKNKEKTCKGQRIFDENFLSLDTNVWKHEIKMPTQPDYEFVTFTESPNVTYVENGKLFIKPIVQPASYINGKVNLEKCTGVPGSEECAKQAYSYNILPPVESGRITTKKSFGFRYGSVQVRARLPIGDWIVPEIRLIPRDSAYGEHYMSGQIRIVMNHGNRQLKCDRQDLNNKYIEFGVYVGLPGNVKRKVVTKVVDENGWLHRYHNFTLLWTPDNLQFFVDDEALPALISSPQESIRSVTNQPSNAAYIWDAGSKLAPFDREFHVSLGVTVGGIRDFPDTCCTAPKKKKPWVNNSPKAMLNFWQARAAWQPTWSDGRPQLEVEHVKIYAL